MTTILYDITKLRTIGERDDMIAERRVSTPRRRTVLAVAACSVLALVLAVGWRPPTQLPAATVGDESLGQLGREALGDDRPALAIACVSSSTIETAVMGADATDRFEIGSVKQGTHRAPARRHDRAAGGAGRPALGALAGDRRVGRGDAEQLATHTSGLPTRSPP